MKDSDKNEIKQDLIDSTGGKGDDEGSISPVTSEKKLEDESSDIVWSAFS